MGLKSLIKNYNELGHDEFMKKWKDGMQKITPEQLVKTELIGYIGNLIGTIIVCVILAFTTVWYIIFAFAFGILINISQGIGKWQQLQQIKTINKLMNNQINVEDYVNGLNENKNESTEKKE